MALRVPESKFWDHFYRPKPPPKPPFRPSRNPNRTSKSDFWPFYWIWPFSHWNSHWSQKKLRTAEGVVLQQKQKVFRNLWTKWNNLKPCRSWNFNFHQNKNHPTQPGWKRSRGLSWSPSNYEELGWKRYFLMSEWDQNGTRTSVAIDINTRLPSVAIMYPLWLPHSHNVADSCAFLTYFYHLSHTAVTVIIQTGPSRVPNLPHI